MFKSAVLADGGDRPVETMKETPEMIKIMESIRNELAVATKMELINKMTEKCFHKCVSKPGTKLDGSEQMCLAKCMDRYMESWNVVSRVYAARLQREAKSEDDTL